MKKDAETGRRGGTEISPRHPFPLSPRLPFRVDPDLHLLKNLKVFFREFEAGAVRDAFLVSGVGPQSNLEPEREFHLVSGFAQTFNRLCDFRRVFH